MRRTVATALALCLLILLLSATAFAELSDFVELQQGDKGPDVVALQKNLIYLRLMYGSADGDYGAKTASAVKAFQEIYAYEATGIADVDTQEEIAYQVERMGGDSSSAIQCPMPTALDFTELSSVSDGGNNEKAVVRVRLKAHASQSYSKQDLSYCYTYIQDLVEMYGFARYQALDYSAMAMISNVEQVAVSFTVPHSALVLLAQGEIASYDLSAYVDALYVHPALAN